MDNDIDAHTVPPTLVVICKDGGRVDAYAEVLSLASPVLADMINVARKEPEAGSRKRRKTLGEPRPELAAPSTPEGGNSSTTEASAGAHQAAFQSEDGVVELQCPDDSPEDWRGLLDIFHPGKRFKLCPSDDADVDTAVRLLRLADKYSAYRAVGELTAVLTECLRYGLTYETCAKRVSQMLQLAVSMDNATLIKAAKSTITQHMNEAYGHDQRAFVEQLALRLGPKNPAAARAAQHALLALVE